MAAGGQRSVTSGGSELGKVRHLEQSAASRSSCANIRIIEFNFADETITDENRLSNRWNVATRPATTQVIASRKIPAIGDINAAFRLLRRLRLRPAARRDNDPGQRLSQFAAKHILQLQPGYSAGEQQETGKGEQHARAQGSEAGLPGSR